MINQDSSIQFDEQEYQLTTPTIYCKVKEHQGEKISHVCLMVSCKEFRPHCKRCNLSLHRDCLLHGHVKFLDDLTLSMNQIQEKNRQMLQIVEEALKNLQKLERQLQSRRDLIDKYIEQSNLTNLNNLAGILESYENYDFNKLHEGQQQFSNIFNSRYVQNLEIKDYDLQNIENIGKVQPQTANQIDTEQLNSQNNKDSQNTQVDPRRNNNIYTTPSSRSETNNGNTQNNMGNQDEIDQANLCLEQGQFYFNKEEYANALESFELAIALDPNNIISYNKKGVTLSKLNRDVEGIEFFDEALKIINSKPQIDKVAKLNSLRYKAGVVMKIEQFDFAMKIINEGLALDPRDEQLFELKIFILAIYTNKSREALQFVDEAIRVDEKNYQAHYLKVGFILCKLKNFDEAMESLGFSNSIRPSDKTYQLLGNTLDILKRYAEAESCFKSALELNQNNQRARQGLIDCQQAQRQSN